MIMKFIHLASYASTSTDKSTIFVGDSNSDSGKGALSRIQESYHKIISD